MVSVVAKLQAKLAGIETEIQCAPIEGVGSPTNTATSVNGTGVFALVLTGAK
jgi:hypothetical protein